MLSALNYLSTKIVMSCGAKRGDEHKSEKSRRQRVKEVSTVGERQLGLSQSRARQAIVLRRDWRARKTLKVVSLKFIMLAIVEMYFFLSQ